ncbi:MAG: glycosyltransferase family 2 protein [Anaerolineaceae bacterium]|nr:glycosyltransferase family 2 protein [Anaerolineaceae bacterium]
MSTPFLSLILPAHNEAERLPHSLKLVQEFINRQTYESEVLVIENASADDTAKVVEGYQASFPQLKMIRLEQGGKGNAIRAGMQAARGEYRFMADVDFSMPVEEISKFLPPNLAETQVAIASREQAGSKRIAEPFYRHLIGRVFNGLVRILVLPGLQDTQCGFKCFSAEAAEQIFPKQTLNGWSFDVEVLTIARELGFKVLEVPITWTYQPGSRMSILSDSWQMFKDLLLIRSRKRKGLYRGKTV